MKKAFTLIELLVVIAIIAILAAILFPVFAQAKDAAKKTACLSNIKQTGTAYQIYVADNDDTAALWMYNGTFNVTQGDRSWGNIMFPYMKSREMLKTPNSPIGLSQRVTNANFPNPSSLPAASRTDQELYNLGWLTDYGYNYQNFTGFIFDPTVPVAGFRFSPVSMTSVNDPSNTILLLTGVFERVGGAVSDGGQLPIDPPCRRLLDGTDTTANNGSLAYFYGGWRPDLPNAWNVFGGAWPYYTGGGQKSGARISIGFSDSSAKMLTIPQIARGCNVLPQWTGRITDRAAYLWDRD
ncbi:MAG: prepilin-type N-terminal cleavage/methylation domain-containing protein [Fimbriimonadaceae bacterium]|jgi:prepilin-type N-terminal cleavage/methylation domain-containing protein|nr:prepilin-type N-terminal cleavage/methylation domain-containing protein [Fimbriimonadaceae bacterium]